MDGTAGLNLYLSNGLDILSEYFLDNFKQSYVFGNFFEQKEIIIQTPGIAKWLSYKISDNVGVCANVRFMFPKEFILKTLEQNNLLKSDDIRFYDKSNITMNILKGLDGNAGELLSEYTKDKNAGKLGQFVSYLADLFDQYMTYRPEFVKNPDLIKTEWQKALFADILDKNHITLSYAIEQFIAGQHTLKSLSDKSIELFAISLLPPEYIYFFRKLSESARVNLYVLNPSSEFWFDEPSEALKLRMQRKTGINKDKAHFQDSNPILINNGKLTQDFLSLLYEGEGLPQPQEIEKYEEFDGLDDDLTLLKNKILKNDPKNFYARDATVQIHSYQTKLREIEGLYNAILRVLNNDSDICLEDMVVMCPKIDEYSSFIDGVFADKDINYTVSDSKMPDEDEGIKAVFYIIENLRMQLGVNGFIEFMELEAIKRKFNISNSDTELIKEWLEKINLRWGLKEKYIKDNFDAMNVFNTFEYAIKRLLYGYMSSKDGIVDGVLAYEELSLSNEDILGKISYLVNKLIYFCEEMQKTKKAKFHIETINSLIETFIDDSLSQSAVFLMLKDEMEKYKECDTEMPFFVFYEILKSAINKSRREFNFLRGGITFCELVPLRSIPFKAVFLIGMNAEEFPRSAPKVSFNEMEQSPKKGDRSSRLNDRLLFLETILSAKKYLYISYIGKDIKRNTVLNPSIVVEELATFLNLKAVEHPLHSFNIKYFENTNDILCNFSKEDYELAKNVHYVKKRTKKPLKQKPVMDSGTDDYNKNSVLIEDVLRFIRHPVKFFFKENGIILTHKGENPDDFENIELNALDRYKVLKAVVYDKKPMDIIRHSGILPHGSLGRLSQDGILSLKNAIESNLKKIDETLTLDKLEKKTVCVESKNGFGIEGDIPFLFDEDTFVYLDYSSYDKRKIPFVRILEIAFYKDMLNLAGNNIKNVYFVNTKECLSIKINAGGIVSFVADDMFVKAKNRPIIIFEPEKFDEKISVVQNLEKTINRYRPTEDDVYMEYLTENFDIEDGEYKHFIYDINKNIKKNYGNIKNAIQSV